MSLERWGRITMGAVVAAAGVFILYRLRLVLVTVALAAMLAYALLPLVEWTARLRVGSRPVPRLVAVVVVFLVVGLGITELVRIAAGPVGAEAHRFAQNLHQYRDQVGTLLTRVRTSVARELPPPLRQPLDRAMNQAEVVLVSALTGALQATAKWLSHVVEVVLIPILAFYFLVDLPVLREELLGFLPPGVRQPVLVLARRADGILAGYVRAQLILMMVSGVVVGVGLAVIGMRFPLLLGIVAGLTRAIPIIGPVLGAIPIVGLAALQSSEVALAVLVFFVILQLAESKIILPKIIGHELRLHAVTILLALLIGNALFGLMGMFLAPPAAAFVKALREVQEEALLFPEAVGARRAGDR